MFFSSWISCVSICCHPRQNIGLEDDPKVTWIGFRGIGINHSPMSMYGMGQWVVQRVREWRLQDFSITRHAGNFHRFFYQHVDTYDLLGCIPREQETNRTQIHILCSLTKLETFFLGSLLKISDMRIWEAWPPLLSSDILERETYFQDTHLSLGDIHLGHGMPNFLGGGFKHFFNVYPWEKWSNLMNIFEMGWNHQLDVGRFLYGPQCLLDMEKWLPRPSPTLDFSKPTVGGTSWICFWNPDLLGDVLYVIYDLCITRKIHTWGFCMLFHVTFPVAGSLNNNMN